MATARAPRILPRILSATLAVAAMQVLAATDADILAARDAAQRGDSRALAALAGAVAGHPLEHYPTYWLLSGSVERADPAEVAAFLARHADTPLAEALRKEWLKALGAAGSWERFREELPRLAQPDADITCYSFQDRMAREDPEVTAEARALFAAGREVPGACDPVFSALVAQGHLGEREIWSRIRKLLGGALVKDARRTNALLPARRALGDKALGRAHADPGAYLAREKSPVLSRAAKELVIYALARLARNRPDEAGERMELFAARLGDDARHAWGQVAFQAAMNHHPAALGWYAKAQGAALTDAQLAWRARAALRAGDWKEVLAAVEALPPAMAREGAWRYWRARALQALGEEQAAQALLKALAGRIDFYGLLAAEETGVEVAPEWNGFRPMPTDLDRVRAYAGIERALALYRIGLDNEALREWLWAVNGLDDRDLLAAAEVARLAELPERAINTANRTVQLHDYAQRFPIPHRELLADATRRWGLDKAMVYAIIRQESRFMSHARSPVGATGLMQLMPATARWVARQIPIQPFNAAMLRQPEVNVNMGTYYFHRVLADLGGTPILAAAAYNAGPGRARRWRDAQPLEGAIYAETIPFNETRRYVKQVFTNTWFYHHRLTGRPASLRELLGVVPGHSIEAADAVATSWIP